MSEYTFGINLKKHRILRNMVLIVNYYIHMIIQDG